MECDSTLIDVFIGITIGAIATLIIFAVNSDKKKKRRNEDGMATD